MRVWAILLVALLLAAPAIAQPIRTQQQAQNFTLSAWTSATALNSTQTIVTPGDAGFDGVMVNLVQTSTITAGAINFQVTFDNSTWVTIPADAVRDPTSTTWATIPLPYTLQASTNKAFEIHTKGWQGLRIILSTAITGTGSVTPNVTMNPDQPIIDVIALSPTAANFNATVTPATATGAASPAVAQPVGGNGTGNLTQYLACDSFAVSNANSTSGNTQLVALTSGQTVYVCGWAVTGASTTLNTVKLVYGTGTACATGQTDLSIAVPIQASASTAPYGATFNAPSNTLWKTAASNALCVNLSAAQSVNVQVWYTKF